MASHIMSRSKEIIIARIKTLFPDGCRKILLVAPVVASPKFLNKKLIKARRFANFPPYGCGILARQIKSRGYQASIIDLNYHVLQSLYLDPDNIDHSIWKHKLSDKIREFQPDLIGISVLFSISHDCMVDTCRFIKEAYPGIPVIGGGVYFSNDPENILRSCRDIDLLMLYESDEAFPDLIDIINGKLPVETITQLAILDNGQYISIDEYDQPDISQIDVQPDFLDLPIGDYNRYGAVGAYNFMTAGRMGSIVQSNRGCRGRCTFCSIRNINGKGVRARPVSSVVDEIEQLYNEHQIRHIMWLDDDLFYDESRAIKLFNEICRRNLDITWDASNGVIASAITPDLLCAAAESGCIGLHIGLESGNRDIIKSIRKPSSIEHYYRAKQVLDNYPRIFIKGFLILGFPNENIGQIMETIRMACELEFHWYPIQFLSPLPKTDITQNMIDQGLITQEEVSPQFKGETVLAKSTIGGSLRQREIMEKEKSVIFENFLESRAPSYIPSEKELRDIWFAVDYRINYEKLIHISNTVKARMISMMLRQITDEFTFENSLGNLFMAVLEQKLGNLDEGRERLGLAEKFLNESAYWQRRYEALEIHHVVDQVRSGAFSNRYALRSDIT